MKKAPLQVKDKSQISHVLSVEKMGPEQFILGLQSAIGLVRADAAVLIGTFCQDARCIS